MRKWIAVALLLLAGTGGYLKLRPEPASARPAAPAPDALPVEAVPVRTAPLARELIAVGTLRSSESVTLASEITGRVAKVAVEEGRRVEQGTVLFELDDSLYRAEVAQARAQARLSQSNYERAREVHARKLISERERDEVTSQRDVAQATLRLAEARLAKTRIAAPFSGIAGLRRVSPGDYVQPGQALVNIEAVDPMKLDFQLPESALSAVAVDQPLKLDVDAYPGESFAGTVYAIDPRLGEQTRAISVRAQVPNADHRLRPGLFARVRLVVSQKQNALMIPEQALIPEGDGLFVYVIADGKAQRRDVRVGQRRPGYAEILTGLSAGDTVITGGLQKVAPGTAVKPVQAPPAAQG